MQIYLFSTLFKIEGSADRTKKPYVRAGSSTQSVKLQTSGSGSVHSRGDNLPKNRGGRTTKNSLKTLQPPIVEISPPTHPVVANFENSASALEKNCSGVDKSQLPALPTISQLRDFPNISVGVQLPHSAPSSPISINSKTQEIVPGNPTTPSSSPAQVSVILTNPNLLPETQTRPRSSTPVFVSDQPFDAAGSWDNYLDDPTYKKFDSEFWSSRSTRQVQLVSTDVSDFADISLSLNSSVSEIPVLDTGMVVENPTMEAAAQSLKEQEVKVRDMCSDCDPDLITSDSAPSMREELTDIGSNRDQYRSGVRKFLIDYAELLSSAEKLQWESDLKSLVSHVNKHKFNVMAKVNQLLPTSARMTAFEQASIEVQKKQLAILEEDKASKADEAKAIAMPLKTLLLEKWILSLNKFLLVN